MNLSSYRDYYSDSQSYVSEEEYESFLDYRDFLKDKRVVVVAPSKSTLSYRRGDFIDSHDIVVRLNNGFRTTGIEEFVGSRTDIVFHGLNPKSQYRLRLKSCLKFGTKFISYWGAMFDRTTRYKQQIKKGRLDVQLVHMGDRFQMYQDLGLREHPKLLIGMGAAFHLSREFFEPKEILLYGFDFYRTAHHDNCYDQTDAQSLSRAHDTHDIEANRFFLKTLLQARPEIKVDSITEAALS